MGTSPDVEEMGRRIDAEAKRADAERAERNATISRKVRAHWTPERRAEAAARAKAVWAKRKAGKP